RAPPGPGAAHGAAADRALPGQGPPAAPHRQRPAGRGRRPAAGRDLAARVVHPHVRPGHAVPAEFRLVGSCGRRRGGCRGRRVESGARRDGFGVRPARRAVRAEDSGSGLGLGLGQLAVYRGWRADRHRGKRAADPADGGLSPGHAASHVTARAVGNAPAAAAAPDEAAGGGADPRRHRRSRRRGGVRADLVLRAAVRPAGAARGADVFATGVRVRGPGGHGVDDRSVRVAERVVVGEFGAVLVAAGQHVLVTGHARDHHVTHDIADYLAYDVTIDVHVGVGIGVRVDLFVRSDEHLVVGRAALVDAAVVLVGIYVGELTRVPAVIGSVLVTASAREGIAVALSVASRANPAQAASAGLNPLVTLAGVPRFPWAVNTAVEMAMAKTPPRRCAM